MAEFIVFCIPTIIYLIVQSRIKDSSFRSSMIQAGLAWGPPSSYAWATLLLLPLVLTGWLAIFLVPADVLELPGVSVAKLTALSAVVSVIVRALGEEVFFRGLLGGVLVRNLGFGWGNLAQSVIFLVPHLALLLVDVRLWPVVPVQFAAGWLLGWLRHKADSLIPGVAVHAIANVVAGLIAT